MKLFAHFERGQGGIVGGADEIVTYDDELADAARRAGLAVFAPAP